MVHLIDEGNDWREVMGYGFWKLSKDSEGFESIHVAIENAQRKAARIGAANKNTDEVSSQNVESWYDEE